MIRLLLLGKWTNRWLFSRDRPEFVGRKEEDRRANRLFSLLRAADRDRFKMEAADSTALVDALEGDAVAGELVVVVEVTVVDEGVFGMLNRVLNGLLNTLFVRVLEDANELK